MEELRNIKNSLIDEIKRRQDDRIIEKTNAELIIKLINSAENINEAISIAELGTTYKRIGIHFDKFSFDSEAEREWASILKEISYKTNGSNSIIKSVVIGKDNPNKNMINLFGKEEDKIDPKMKYLWGKNFITNSSIKFEYYFDGIYAYYPDFILIDNYERVHIFEVKSVNVSNQLNIDPEKYKDKIHELKKSYKKASELTGYNFYLPILKNDIWYITRYNNGNEDIITKEQFINCIINN